MKIIMKISFVCLMFVFFTNELIGNNHYFIEKANTETIVSFVKRSRLSAEEFAKKLDQYPLLNPNTQDKDGWTILHDLMSPSVKNGYLKAFVKKYAADIDINKANSDGQTALDLGLFHKNHAALDIILKHTTSVSATTAINFLKHGKGHDYLKTDTYKTKYRDKILHFRLDLKRLLFNSFLYGLATPPHMAFDPETWHNKKPFLHYFVLPVMLSPIFAWIASLLGPELQKFIDITFAIDCDVMSKEYSFISGAFIQARAALPVITSSVGLGIGSFLRFLLLDQQRKYPLLHQCIQKNSRLAVILDSVISGASLIALHRIRSA